MLKVHTRNLGDSAVLCLQGRIVSGETRVLRAAVNSQSKVSAVILDLARVTTIDARGLGVLLELREQAESKGIGFELINVSRLVTNVLKITRLDSVFRITPAVELFSTASRRRRIAVSALAPCA